MSWLGPVLDDDQRDLASMLDDLAADRGIVLDGDDPAVVAALTAELAALGVWTLGAPESSGGGGADRLTTAVALERLGRAWPALGWAAVQAHAAVGVLAGDPPSAALVADLHTAREAVAVVDADAVHVRLARDGGALTGSVDRIDAGAQGAHVLVLVGGDRALLLAPSALTATRLRRTGLGGAFTSSVRVAGGAAEVRELEGVDTAAARVRLRLGAAAVAAGIAGAAADGALEYASGRRQFGDRLTALPTVRQSLLGQAGRTAVALSAAVAAAEDPVQASAVLREACEAAIDVAAAALQAHGGYGYLSEYPAERRLRDAVSLRAAADPQTAALTAARTLAGLAPAPALRKEAS